MILDEVPEEMGMMWDPWQSRKDIFLRKKMTASYEKRGKKARVYTDIFQVKG